MYSWKDTETPVPDILPSKNVTRSWSEQVMPAMQMYSAGKFVGSTSDSAENEYRSVHTETRSVVKFTNIVTEPDRLGGIPGRL